jgi:hypothetical protein
MDYLVRVRKVQENEILHKNSSLCLDEKNGSQSGIAISQHTESKPNFEAIYADI